MKRIMSYLIALLLVSCGLNEPFFMSVNITNCSRHKINENFMKLTPETLQAEIYLKTKDLDSLQWSKFFIKLSIANNARMDDVRLAKREFRKANILKIKYYEIEDVICGGF